MLRILTLVVLLLATANTYAQDSTLQTRRQWAIMAGAFLTPAPAAKGGFVAVQRRLGRKWAVLGELGYAFIGDVSKQDISGWNYLRTALELKWFFWDSKELGLYLSSYNGFNFREFTRTNGVYYEPKNRMSNNAYYEFETAVVRSPILVNVLRFGYEIRVGSFVIDASSGAGMRSFFTSYKRVVNPQHSSFNTEPRFWSNPAYDNNEADSRFALNFSLRLGWQF